MEKGEVYAYLADVKNANADALYANFGASMEASRKERIERCTNAREKTTLVATGALLQGVLKREGVTADMIDYGEHGKPFIKGREDLFINISHSGNYVLIALSGQEIGVDIQKPVPFKESLVNEISSMDERSKIEKDVVKRLNYVWAIKESYTKLTGEGIGKKLSEVTYDEYEDHLDIFDNGEKSAYAVMVYSDDIYSAIITAREPFAVKNLARMSL